MFELVKYMNMAGKTNKCLYSRSLVYLNSMMVNTLQQSKHISITSISPSDLTIALCRPIEYAQGNIGKPPLGQSKIQHVHIFTH